jgi:hypothetical protein
MATDRSAVLAVPAAAALLLWPALWNCYPIVFADTGTYLSQAIARYAGWDRPVFYSLFMLPLHATLTVWPVVVVQALGAAWVLWLVCLVLVPDMSGVAFVGFVFLMSAGTWLPWLVCELMPDLFTPLLVLVLCLLAWVPERLSRWQQIALVGLAAFMIASQQSSLPLACVLLVVLGLLRGPGRSDREAWRSESWGPGLRRPGSWRLVLGRFVSGRFVSWRFVSSRFVSSRFVSSRSGSALSVSWPGLARPPTTCGAERDKVVGGRAKPGHDTNGASHDTKGASHDTKGASHDTNGASHDTGGVSHDTGGPDTGGNAKRPTSSPLPRHRWLLIILPPALAALGLCTTNLAAHGRFAIAPFGNVFLLARVIYDGPGRAILRRDCPTQTWILCPFLDSLPANSDDFLWTKQSPLYRAGGPKAVSRDADAIIAASLLADPAAEAQAALANALEQLTRFASGDGLNAWSNEVSPVIARHFPAREQAAYAAARQQAGSLAVPAILARVHTIVALAGTLACVLLLVRLIATRHAAHGQHATCAGFLIAALLALPVSAAITGALSAPHDRYQARIMWLPPFVAVPAFAAMRRRRA